MDSKLAAAPEPMATPIKPMGRPPLRSGMPRRRTVMYGVVVLLLALNGATFAWQYLAVRSASAKATNLSAQVTSAKVRVAALNALNNGTVLPAAKSTLPPNQIGLMSDKVVLTLPKGWVQAPADDSTICTAGTIDAKPIICDDAVTVLPAALVSANQNAHYVYSPFQLDISVFEHTDGTNAKDWLSTDYGEGLPTMGEPQAVDQSGALINGYDAFTFVSQYSDTPYPSTIFYAVVHGNYAVVARATYMTTLNPTGTAGNDVNEDYSQYLPDIKSLINSITFRG